MLKNIDLLDDEQVNFINVYQDDHKEAYCSKCGEHPFENAKYRLNEQVDNLLTYVKNNIKVIPVISIHTPHKWDYTVLGIVTGQTTTGTGLVSEFASDFTDFFGGQSGSYNKKIASGEINAMNQLRAKTARMKGNAVIATDLDYSEMGSTKGMIMVCATGTAVKLHNTDVLGNDVVNAINEFEKNVETLEKLRSKYSNYLSSRNK